MAGGVERGSGSLGGRTGQSPGLRRSTCGRRERHGPRPCVRAWPWASRRRSANAWTAPPGRTESLGNDVGCSTRRNAWAPKFPLPSQLSLALRLGTSLMLGKEWTNKGRHHGMNTLLAMERGGIHDHVGGGYARYSVDERWHVPHFEKMLYDNAQMLGVTAEAWALERNPALWRSAQGLWNSWSVNWTTLQEGSNRPWMPTATAKKERTTCGGSTT